MSTNEVGMKMRFENVFDASLAIGCQLRVGLIVTQWVDDGCLAIAFNIISGLTQAAGVQLLDIHASKN